MKKFISALLAIALLAGAFVCAPSALSDETAQLCEEILAAELPRLRNFQLSNGAIPMYDIRGGGQSKLSPYFSCSAALGLLAGGDLAAAESYIRWHFSHLETEDINGLDGTIYDYTIQIDIDGTITETPAYDYDSTDSYAALFLILLDEYLRAGGDIALLEAHREDIGRITSAMDATRTIALTYAKPGYKAYYLMDNCETAAGYRAAASLWDALGNPIEALRCRWIAWLMQTVVNLLLWNWFGGSYDYALGNATDTTVFYPDAAAQLFPVAFGLICPTGSRAKRLYQGFLEAQPQWLAGNDGAFPWVILTRATLAMGDEAATAAYLRAVKARYIDGEPSSRWYCQESGLAVWAAVRCLEMG